MESRRNQQKKSEPDPWGGMSLSDALQSGPNRQQTQQYGVQRGLPRQSSQQRSSQSSIQQVSPQQPSQSYQQPRALPRRNQSNNRPIPKPSTQIRPQNLPRPNKNTHQQQPPQNQATSSNQYNEYQQNEFEQMILSERPDPSKKQVCREDQPVALNPSGKYNLNFIDWDNEWERVYEFQNYYNNDRTVAPIHGMDVQAFERLYVRFMSRLYFKQDQYTNEEQKENGVREEILVQLPIKTVKKEDPSKLCSICLKAYSRGQKVFFLQCKHHFHIECIKPWFEKNHICPNCRYDINESKHT